MFHVTLVRVINTCVKKRYNYVYVNKGITSHASSHPSSHDDAKREREKEEERKHEFCRRQAHFRSKHVLGVRQQEGKEEEEECHRFFSASKDAKEEFNRLC